MGRYSSVQTFSDQRTKVVPGDAVYKDSAGAGAGAPRAARPEKVETVMGSNTGAGSCEFHLYRAARSREIMRLETIESTAKKAEDSAAFAAKVETNKRAAEERTKKNAEKRKRRKQKKGNALGGGASGGDEDENDDDGSDALPVVKTERLGGAAHAP